MSRSKRPHSTRKPARPELDIEADLEEDESIDENKPLPRIDRRHVPRTRYQTTAWLAPADDTGAVRRPIIRTRDVSLRSMGFLSRQDISALGEAILRLPATTGRYIAVACRVRRSMELNNGWFDCLIEFLQPQPDLARRHIQLCEAAIAKKSNNNRRRK